MTVSNINPPVTRYSGNGVTTAFSTVFVFNSSSELVVTLTDSSGTDTVQTITTHYTVSGGAGSTGTVTMLSAPASGYTITIARDTPLTQSTDYVENDSFPAETHEAALDKLTRIVQEIDYAGRRALTYPATSGIVDLSLPSPEAATFLRWNATEDGLENATILDVDGASFPVATGILAQTATNTFTNRTITGTTNQISVTNGDGVSGNPTLAFDSTIRMTDSALEIVDNSDSTKKLKFEASGITTATTRTLTIPDASGTIALTSTVASIGASYVTLGTDATLTNERVLTAGSGITLTDGGAGSTITVASDIATQADQETGSSTTKIVTSGRQQYHASSAKFWVSTTGSGTPTKAAEYNAGSITDNGTGDWTFAFTTSFSSSNYSCVAMPDDSTNSRQPSCFVQSKATGSVRVRTIFQGAGGSTYTAIDPATGIDVVCYGDQ